MLSKNLKSSLLLATALLASCGAINNFSNRNWHGADVGGHTYASFDEMNGRQNFKLNNPATGQFYLKYSSEIPKGELRLVIKSDSKVIVDRDLTGSVKDSVHIDNTNNPSVKICLTGKQAQGKFDISYPTAK